MLPETTFSSARAFRTSWVAAFFALIVGVMLVYVPYEFSAPIFRHIAPYARLLGTGFLGGGMLVGVCALYPEWPRWLDLLGRTVLIGALGIYWWNVNVITGGVTGAVVYALMIACVLLEARPNRRATDSAEHGTFLPFVAVSAIGLGLLMATFPALFPERIFRYLLPIIRPLGVLFAGFGVMLAWAVVRDRTVLARQALAALSVPFATLAASLFLTASWSGVALYLSIVAGSAGVLWRERVQAPVGIRWRLWRGMVIASCVPLIALGAVACVLTQQGIEEQARAEARLAVDAEVEWLSEHFGAEREALMGHARLPVFAQAVRSGDREAIELSMEVLRYHTVNFESVFLLDTAGQVRARIDQGLPRSDDQSESDHFRGGVEGSGLYVSVPYVSRDGNSRVALSAPVKEGGQLLGVLVGTVSLQTLSAHHTLASRRYSIQLVDRRTQHLLRETEGNNVGVPAWLPQPLQESPGAMPSGSFVGPNADGQQVSVTWAPVPQTPWLVVVSQPVDATYRAVTRLGLGAALFVTVGALLALFISRLVASEVTRRVERLRLAAASLAEGELSVRVRAEGSDELDALANAFNRMARKVEAAESELRRSNEELKSAVAIRDQFLSLASHELRTPLTPLKATAQTLRLLLSRRDRPLDPERVRTMLDRMDRQTDRLAMLVGDMLDTSRIQAGRFVLNLGQMDLAALVEEVVERQRAAHPHVAERLRLVRPAGPVEGAWDAPRLEQVVVNLLENAIRYSPEGGEVRLVVRDEGDAVQLDVEDQGIGIPQESLGQLFEPFFRASNAADRHFGGLGLGLHICREITARHGGQIWGESRGEGKGSAFHVRLPRVVTTVGPTPDAPAEASPPDASRAA